MLPNPLHPSIVHFPVVLAFFLPIFAFGAVWTIRRGARPTRAWSIPLALAVALVASTWAAVQSGEAANKRVEGAVPEQPLEHHENLAEQFFMAAGVLAAVAAVGLVKGRTGRIARIATAVGGVILIADVARVGHSGGELVYRYGAANAYLKAHRADSASAAGSVQRPEDLTREKPERR
jgi:uncharacterized membrane protein